METKRYVLLSGCLFLLVVLLAACVGSESRDTVDEAIVIEAQGETVMAAPEEPIEAPRGEVDESSSMGSGANLALVPPVQRMVIKDAEMELLVDNTDAAMAQVTQMANDYGGYIISAQTWFTGEHKFATVRLGVPSGNFETVLNNLRNLGIKVVKETVSGQDVTAEYVDLETRLTNLEATAERVRGFLDEADTVEEALKVNQQLSQLEGEIEQVKGQMRFYEGRSAFSTITVSLTPQFPTPTPTLTPTPTPTPTPEPGWNPGATLEKSAGVLETLAKFTVDVLIWLVVIAGPFAIVALIIFLVGRSIWRRTKRTEPTEERSNLDD